MPLFDVKNVTLADLQSLIDAQVFENKELEYKDYSFPNGKLSPQTKDKFPKEITAFANTNGGIIVIGMKEDDNRLPTEITGTGMSLSDFDEWLSSFRQVILSRIRPHLHGVECKPVKLDDTNIAIVITTTPRLRLATAFLCRFSVTKRPKNRSTAKSWPNGNGVKHSGGLSVHGKTRRRLSKGARRLILLGGYRNDGSRISGLLLRRRSEN